VRVFFDTNVLVSAFLARGLCADLLRLVLSEHTLATSEVVVAELRDVLSRKGRLPLQQVEAIETLLRDRPVAPRPQHTLALGLVDGEVMMNGCWPVRSWPKLIGLWPVIRASWPAATRPCQW